MGTLARRRASERPGRHGSPERYAISPDGRAAAYVTASCLVVAGAAFTWASIDELFCRGRALGLGSGRAALDAQAECDLIGAIAALFVLVSLAALATGATIWWRTRRRPVVPDARGGRGGWRWGEGALLAAGTAVLATRLPRFTCPAGFRLDERFGLCISSLDRFDASDHAVARATVALVGVAVGLLLVRARWIPQWVVAPITLLGWFGGIGWLLVDTMAPELLGA